MLGGIDDNTPLYNLIRIRAEKDPEKINKMSSHELGIRQKWFEFISANKREVSEMNEQEKKKLIEANEKALKESLMTFAIIKHK